MRTAWNYVPSDIEKLLDSPYTEQFVPATLISSHRDCQQKVSTIE